ncbi:fumarate hydratase [Candidatus Aminicenantes bacterium AC-708-M15]|jgi:fumarate hydratase subunit alpha|nr:fumarate hydratase [SCandidatus Aminicenantes bacterium Aminicenantia_JdfR_composite]MCP2597116.1 fumarate hydratase [Candidatus Aminicenantes bacterium AC-335-G13]MCP2598241.1 fumarate hydratase [Candidatus Aminicenantes bacterium AC-335-L06]MCP2598873.1 fumarate hydratase [Candidatus Aminicenantes bacterium AC-335-B20]MCP2604366.1 fumarate hydratase [Candidatus Aminicenantes bacterium AC-708-M15]MCP2618671.1 fumarate hydratase [Candidatus Aminicenantes bacterium AC-335-A11]
MKVISLKDVKENVKNVVQKANFELNEDVINVIKESMEKEESPEGKAVFDQLLENAEIARKEKLGLCQDTGLAVFFVELGEEIQFKKEDGLESLSQAINEGVREGYKEGYLRKSVVEDPLRRKNTGDNTPAFIHWELVPGDKFKVTFMAKGGGAENMSAIRMLAPAAGQKGIEDFVVETVDSAGPNPCPPIIVGVGIGGNFETSALLAKKALLRRPLGSHHSDPFYADMEKRLLERINKLGIGPQGIGGRITALAVHIEVFPCHIASLPVAVNIQCHSHRLLTFEL